MKSQSQFNWIFIIIAGAIILTFFVNFGLRYKSLQDEKLSIELLINLDNALFNLQASPFNTFDVVNIPKDLEITCNNFKIGNRNYSNDKLIFSPKHLKDKIYIYYKPFNFPFKIENFYYIISPDDKFYLIASDQKSREFAQSLINDLLGGFRQNIAIESTRQATGKNIFINTAANINDVKIILQDNKISINYNNKLYEDLNQELVYGVIFSDNFDCVYNKLKPSLEKTISSYQSKLILLQSSNCNYSPFVQYLNKLRELKHENIKPVEALNQNLASLNCPVLY